MKKFAVVNVRENILRYMFDTPVQSYAEQYALQQSNTDKRRIIFYVLKFDTKKYPDLLASLPKTLSELPSDIEILGGGYESETILREQGEIE